MTLFESIFFRVQTVVECYLHYRGNSTSYNDGVKRAGEFLQEIKAYRGLLSEGPFNPAITAHGKAMWRLVEFSIEGTTASDIKNIITRHSNLSDPHSLGLMLVRGFLTTYEVAGFGAKIAALKKNPLGYTTEQIKSMIFPLMRAYLERRIPFENNQYSTDLFDAQTKMLKPIYTYLTSIKDKPLTGTGYIRAMQLLNELLDQRTKKDFYLAVANFLKTGQTRIDKVSWASTFKTSRSHLDKKDSLCNLVAGAFGFKNISKESFEKIAIDQLVLALETGNASFFHQGPTQIVSNGRN